MAPVELSCEVHGCRRKMTEEEPAATVESLKLNNQQVHGMTRKPKSPEFTMSGDVVEATHFNRFTFLFQQQKKRAGIKAPSHLLYNVYNLQKELLTKVELTLAEAEKNAVAAVSTKYSQEAISNSTNSIIIKKRWSIGAV